MAEYVVGVDVGTESVRAAVVDTSGIFVGTGTVPIATTHPRPGWAEQSPAEWRRALTRAVSTAVDASRASGVQPGDIGAISADGTTCTVVLTDEDGEPVRDALLWMDVRAHEEAAFVSQTGDPALRITGGGPMSAEWMPAKLLWLKKHEPASLARASAVMELTTWLSCQMTGSITGDISTASMRGFYNTREGGFPKSLYSAANLEDVLRKLPDRFAAAGETTGRLSPEVAGEMGLPAGIPVVAGAADAAAALVGMGVTQPGQVGLITGSSHVHLALCETGNHAPGLFGGYPDSIVPGTFLLEGGQVSTGSVLKWFVTQFAQGDTRTGYVELDQAAATIPPGAEGLLVLDHFQGNRTPWSDPTSRGVIRGLTLSHTRAHVYRAILEGIAYGTAVVLSRMASAGVKGDHLVMCGGATASPLWTQIHADVTGTEIRVPAQQQAATLGSAMLAAVGAGYHRDLNAAADAMVRVHSSVKPDMDRHRRYAPYVEQYKSTYLALAGLSGDLVRSEGAG